MNVWLWSLVAIAAAFVLVAVIVREMRLYQRGSGRRGRLVFDTPEARAALRDPDDWFDE